MEDVYLFVYDLSKGTLPAFSDYLLNRTMNGIWHSSVVVYGQEFEYGPKGITTKKVTEGKEREQPETIFKFTKKTHYSLSTIEGFLQVLEDRRYQGPKYNVISNNCHCFTFDLVKNLTGEEIPDYLICLPFDVILASFCNMVSVGTFLCRKTVLNSLLKIVPRALCHKENMRD